jgi:hypothetical protein
MPYEISIVRLPLPGVSLAEGVPGLKNTSPTTVQTEAEALALCRERISAGYEVEVTGPNVHWEHAEVLRRLHS